MKTVNAVLSFLIFLCFFTACSEKENNDLGPDIKWISEGNPMAYTYSNEIVSGYSFQKSFTVLNETSQIAISIQVANDDNSKVSGIFQIEKGKSYSIVVMGTIKGALPSSEHVSDCLEVVFTSLNNPTTESISVYNFLIMDDEIETFFCPSSFEFGEVTITELANNN